MQITEIGHPVGFGGINAGKTLETSIKQLIELNYATSEEKHISNKA